MSALGGPLGGVEMDGLGGSRRGVQCLVLKRRSTSMGLGKVSCLASSRAGLEYD